MHLHLTLICPRPPLADLRHCVRALGTKEARKPVSRNYVYWRPDMSAVNGLNKVACAHRYVAVSFQEMGMRAVPDRFLLKEVGCRDRGQLSRTENNWIPTRSCPAERGLATGALELGPPWSLAGHRSGRLEG